MTNRKNEIKGFLTGLGIGSLLAGLGVYFGDPNNREEVKKNLNKFRKDVDQTLEKIGEEIKSAREENQTKLVKELEQAEKALNEAKKKLESK